MMVLVVGGWRRPPFELLRRALAARRTWDVQSRKVHSASLALGRERRDHSPVRSLEAVPAVTFTDCCLWMPFSVAYRAFHAWRVGCRDFRTAFHVLIKGR